MEQTQSGAVKPADGVEMARGAMITSIAILVANLRAIFTLLVARLLGQAALGTYALAFSTMDVVSKVGVLGLDSGSTALVARAEAVGDRAAAKRLWRQATLLGLLWASAVALVAVLGMGFVGRRLGNPEELIEARMLILAALPGVALYRISNGVSRGRRVMQHEIYSRGLTETLTTILCFLIAFGLGLGAKSPIVAVLAGTAAGGLVASALARRLFRDAPDSTASLESASRKELARFSAPIATYQLLNVLISNMDVLLLGMFVGRVEGVDLVALGTFAAAVEIAAGLRKVRQAFDPIFAPVVAGHAVNHDVERMQGSFMQLGRWMLAVQLPVICLLSLCGGLILSIFGPGFSAGAFWLGLLAVAHGTNTFVGLAETVIMVQKPTVNLFNSGFTVILQLIASLILIPRMGPTGAALAMVLAFVTQGLLSHLELKLLFHWKWSWAPFARPLAAGAAGAVPAIAIRLLWPGLGGQVVAGLVFLAGYALGWRLLGLEPEDKAVLEQLLRRRKAKREARS